MTVLLQIMHVISFYFLDILIKKKRTRVQNQGLIQREEIKNLSGVR